MKRVLLTLLFTLSFGTIAAFPQSCSDQKDTYNDYDNKVFKKEINDVAFSYYVLSYSWAPDYCKKAAPKNKIAGKRDYLQCGSGKEFGYILHGLWPQGAYDKKSGYPRACEGDQKKIDRKILEKYLCMTPSLWLLQHEFEYHGTCMHDEALETPEKYLEKAFELHSKLNLPKSKMHYSKKSVQWFVNNNKDIALSADSIQYNKGSDEWQICYGNNFALTCCPSNCPHIGNKHGK